MGRLLVSGRVNASFWGTCLMGEMQSITIATCQRNTVHSPGASLVNSQASRGRSFSRRQLIPSCYSLQFRGRNIHIQGFPGFIPMISSSWVKVIRSWLSLRAIRFELPVGAPPHNINNQIRKEHFSNRTLVPTSGGISGICGATNFSLIFLIGWVPTVAQPIIPFGLSGE